MAAHEIVPGHVRGIQAEAPMGLTPLLFELRAVLVGELEGSPVVDRRQAAGELALAAELKLFLRLVAGIEAAEDLQPLGCGVIEVEPVRLPHDHVGRDAEPLQIGLDGIRIFLLRARHIRIVEAQDEGAAFPPRIERVEQGHAGVADMDVPGRRRGEANDGLGHGKPYGEGQRAAQVPQGPSPQCPSDFRRGLPCPP
jgi:hypothetical protein